MRLLRTILRLLVAVEEEVSERRVKQIWVFARYVDQF